MARILKLFVVMNLVVGISAQGVQSAVFLAPPGMNEQSEENESIRALHKKMEGLKLTLEILGERLNALISSGQLEFKTFSIVAGDATCNANCFYCVSKMTTSDEMKKDLRLHRKKPDWRNFHKAARLAKMSNATTVIITSKGENTSHPEEITEYLKNLQQYGFPFIELQTNGTLFQNEELYGSHDYLREWYDLGLDTVILSVVSTRSEENKKIFFRGKNIEYPNLDKTIELLHRKGLQVRLGVVGLDGYIDTPEDIKELVDYAKKHGVEQVTWRPVNVAINSHDPEVNRLIEQHRVSREKINAICDYVNSNGTLLRPLPHGADIYDLFGQNFCISNSLTRDTGLPIVRQLIYYATGKITYDWELDGAIILGKNLSNGNTSHTAEEQLDAFKAVYSYYFPEVRKIISDLSTDFPHHIFMRAMFTQDAENTPLRAMKAVYSYYFPEIRQIIQDLLDDFPHEVFMRSMLPGAGLDDFHEPIMKRYVEYHAEAVPALKEFTHRYPTSASDEGIREVMNKIAQEGYKKIYVLEGGEYEGYMHTAASRGLEPEVISADADMSELEPGWWFISNPSARDGNIIPNEFIRKIADAGHQIFYDLSYLGATDFHLFDISHPNIKVVAISFSKPYGLFYFRNGFTFSREPINELYGNKWFKNIFSLLIADAIMKKLSPSELPEKYKKIQQTIIDDLNATYQFGLEASDVFLLAVRKDDNGLTAEQKELLEPYRRGAGYRLTLTPYFFEQEDPASLGHEEALKDTIPDNGVDDYHIPIFEKLIQKQADAVPALKEFSNQYPTNGSEEAIREVMSKIALEGHKQIYVLESEYEGYAAVAKTRGIETVVVTPDTDIGTLEPGWWFISNPSARDGNIIPNEFINKIADAGHQIFYDLSYLDTTDFNMFDISHLNIKVVAISFSKPYGLFYHRVGFTFSREPIDHLFGNKWFKNLFSLMIAEKIIDKIEITELARKYKRIQQEIIEGINEQHGLDLESSDVFLLAIRKGDEELTEGQKEILAQFRRGEDYRLTLTPYLFDRENNTLPRIPSNIAGVVHKKQATRAVQTAK